MKFEAFEVKQLIRSRAALNKFITPLGILLGSLLRSLNNEFITGIAKALSAGTFLYIACSEIIVEEFSISKYKGIKYMFYLLGIIFVICLGFLEEDEDH